MKRIILYIAASLDGYIADKNNQLDWLTVHQGNYGYFDFMQSVDTVLMGRKTYDAVVAMGVGDPHPEQKSIVFTTTPERYTSTKNIHFTSRDPITLAREEQQRTGKDIFLCGGGDLIKTFLETNIVDEIILFIVPILLGGGIPLFKEFNNRIAYETISVKKYDDGMIELRLKKK